MDIKEIPLILCIFDGRIYVKTMRLLSKYIGCLLYILFLVALIISWSFEYFTNSSFFAFYFPTLQCPVFFRANAIKELIGTLGFSVGLIALVYSFWDKRILGLRYRDLVKFKFHSYHICAVAHIVSVACCIVSAVAGTSESALISLAAVIYGFIYQAAAVYWTIWDSKKCAITAKEKYQEIISIALSQNSNESNIELYKYLRKLSDTMPQPADRQYSSQLECFAKTFVAYVVAENRLQPNSQKLLSQITDIWTSMFLAPGPYNTTKDSISFAVDVFNNMEQICRKSSKSCFNFTEEDMVWSWNQICSGYMVCRLNELRSRYSEQESHEKLFRDITKILSVLPSGNDMYYIKDALTSLLVVIMLTSFTAHAIVYNPYVIKMYIENNMLNVIDPDPIYNEIWKKRFEYWPVLFSHLKFTISVKEDIRDNILKYTQKIKLGV